MSASTLAAITSDFADYESVYIPSISPETRTTVLVQKKAAADKKLQKTLRTAFNDIPKSKLTVDDRHTLNLTERAKRGSAAQPMDSVPSVTIDARYRLVHRVWARDMHHVSGWGKPKGVHSCQIWVKVGGEAPTSEKEFAFAGSMTKPPFVVNHDEMDAGKTAYYRARWENNRGEVGTWSTTIAATVWG